ncbi:MAG TPA: tetratricopeptide repeat protein [Urbifossiella sp.]|jgi:tetratricopeptide (TPR) repeat protein|nr:tetratricopeptide repeat protein [Urbifossiella sp.]
MGRADNGFLLRFGALAAGLALLLAGAGGRADDKTPPKPAEKKKATPAPVNEEELKAELLEFNKAKSDEARRDVLRSFTKDKTRAKAGVALAAKMQKAGKGKERAFTFTGALLVGKAAHVVREYDTAEYFYEYCAEAATRLESGEKMLQAYEGLMDLYWEAKRFGDLADVCERFVEMKGPKEVDQARPFVLEKLVQAKAMQGNTDEALRIAESLIQLDEGGWYFTQVKGWVLRQAGRYPAAIDAYQEALDKIDTSRAMGKDLKARMKDRMRYVLSGLHVDNKDIDKASAELQGLIKRNPDNPTYKNDLGYIWADHDMKLDEAEKLVRDALDLDKKRQQKAVDDGLIDEAKETSAYLDSMGWVLFKKKDYKAALPYLKKAAADEEEGDHLEIWDHLADCQLAIGDKAAAIEAWQKGLTFDDLSKRDAARRRQVIVKLKEQGVEPRVPPKRDTPPRRKID